MYILHLEGPVNSLPYMFIHSPSLSWYSCTQTHAHTHMHACMYTHTHFSFSVLNHLKISCRQHGMYISVVQRISSKNKNILLHNQNMIIIYKILTVTP